MLLEMAFIHKPHVYLVIGCQVFEFFYIPVELPGQLWLLVAEAFVVESLADGTDFGTGVLSLQH